MPRIDILMRDGRYAEYLRSGLVKGGFSCKILENNDSFKDSDIILLDAHYRNNYFECYGVDLVYQIFTNNYRDSRILLMSWLQKDQITEYNIKTPLPFAHLGIYNCELLILPISLKCILEQLEKEKK